MEANLAITMISHSCSLYSLWSIERSSVIIKLVEPGDVKVSLSELLEIVPQKIRYKDSIHAFDYASSGSRTKTDFISR